MLSFWFIYTVQSFSKAMNYGSNEGKASKREKNIHLSQELTNQMERYIHHLQYLHRPTHTTGRHRRHFNSGKWRGVKQQQSNKIYKHLVTPTAHKHRHQHHWPMHHQRSLYGIAHVCLVCDTLHRFCRDRCRDSGIRSLPERFRERERERVRKVYSFDIKWKCLYGLVELIT